MNSPPPATEQNFESNESTVQDVQSDIVVPSTLTSLPEEIVILIFKRVALDDGACRVELLPREPFLRYSAFKQPVYVQEKTRNEEDNALTMVNKEFHRIFEEVISTCTLYGQQLDIRAIPEATSALGQLLNTTSVRYISLTIDLNPEYLQENEQEFRMKGLPAITKALRQFPNLTDVSIHFQRDGTHADARLHKDYLIYNFGRTIRSMPKLIGYEIVSNVGKDYHHSLSKRVYTMHKLAAGVWRPVKY